MSKKYIPKTEFFISDVHIPHQIPKAWELTLKIIKDQSPDLIYLGGDIIDFESISRFKKSPEIKLKLQEEINETTKELSRLRAVSGDREIRYREGNHEARLRTYLESKAEELSGLNSLELPKLLRLEEMGINFIKEGTKEKIGELYHLHGHEVKVGSGNPAKGVVDKMGTNVIFGHHHIHQQAFKRRYNGDVVAAYANGTLYTTDPTYTLNPTWTIGFTVIYYLPSGKFSVTPVVFHHKGSGFETILGGKYYEIR